MLHKSMLLTHHVIPFFFKFSIKFLVYSKAVSFEELIAFKLLLYFSAMNASEFDVYCMFSKM